MNLSMLMKDFNGDLFKYTHKKVTINDYNKIKTKLSKVEEIELEDSDEDGLVVAIVSGDEHICTYDEFEGKLYTNYSLGSLLRGKLQESNTYRDIFIKNIIF